MKIYAVVEYYYDNCDVWESHDSYWFTEEQAVHRQIQIEDEYSTKGLSKDHNWADVQEITVEGEMQ